MMPSNDSTMMRPPEGWLEISLVSVCCLQHGHPSGTNIVNLVCYRSNTPGLASQLLVGVCGGVCVWVTYHIYIWSKYLYRIKEGGKWLVGHVKIISWTSVEMSLWWLKLMHGMLTIMRVRWKHLCVKIFSVCVCFALRRHSDPYQCIVVCRRH